MKRLTFSIIVNTLNRGSELQKTLDSLRCLKYSGEFEVVVVNGPSTDNSDEIIASWLPGIRAGKCDEANLSVSRNVGICMAQGDIVAFLDDDAIPEPEWLTQLAGVYKNPMVGAAGGLVYNHTGYEFQYKYCLVDRFGNVDLSSPGPMPQFSFPKSERVPHLLGCNSSFRRSALIEIGGFDEEFEYFLDETDVCLRIIDSGYIISQLPCAYVHHKFAPSNMRGVNKVARDRYSIIKNKIYFMLKHAREFYSLERIFDEQKKFITSQRNEINWAIEEELLSKEDGVFFEKNLERAIETGVQRGLEGVNDGTMINENKMLQYSGDFLPFDVVGGEEYRVIVLVSQDFPPDHGGGIATFTKDLAEALAAEGNIVHVITQSSDINRVDLENGVWVHRLIVQEMECSENALAWNVPQHIWNWSATALEETQRIATHRKIDVIEAPIWDCEGVAFLYQSQWPLVISLQTTLHFWMQSHPEQKSDVEWMSAFGLPMLSLEKEIMQQADAIRSISSAIQRDIESEYNFKFDDKKVYVAPLGMPHSPHIKNIKSVDTNCITLLFVGRLELRKGIDVFLKAIPQVMNSVVTVRIRIIGDDTLTGSDGKTYKEMFLEENSNAIWLSNISFEGRVDNETLFEAYSSCDIFVAPSRFESFGLVFLEAMREGKPVIGCLAGGMPEVISQNVNGLLVKPGDVEALVSGILQLINNEKMRIKMGLAGKAIFEEKFTARRMAQESLKLYKMAENNYQAVIS